jgi:septum formation protein
MKQLVLASTSAYRQELLRRLGLEFIALPPGVNEDQEKATGLAPQALAERLASLKAKALAGPGRVVIGGDQLVNFNGKILGKPGHPDKAFEQLKSMSGKTHELVTAVSVWSEEQEIVFCDITRMTLRPLDDGEIRRYIQADRPLDCAGSYKIEKLGITLMARIETQDFTAIQGLPLMKLAEILRQKGFQSP